MIGENYYIFIVVAFNISEFFIFIVVIIVCQDSKWIRILYLLFNWCWYQLVVAIAFFKVEICIVNIHFLTRSAFIC